jgi:hypothetical protein
VFADGVGAGDTIISAPGKIRSEFSLQTSDVCDNLEAKSEALAFMVEEAARLNPFKSPIDQE